MMLPPGTTSPFTAKTRAHGSCLPNNVKSLYLGAAQHIFLCPIVCRQATQFENREVIQISWAPWSNLPHMRATCWPHDICSIGPGLHAHKMEPSVQNMFSRQQIPILLTASQMFPQLVTRWQKISPAPKPRFGRFRRLQTPAPPQNLDLDESKGAAQRTQGTQRKPTKWKAQDSKVKRTTYEPTTRDRKTSKNTARVVFLFPSSLYRIISWACTLSRSLPLSLACLSFGSQPCCLGRYGLPFPLPGLP